MKIFDVLVCGLAFISLGYFSGTLMTFIYMHRKFWLTPKKD